MSRRGICLIWFRGRHIPPSMPYREARSVAESSEGPTASKSDRTGRNPGMTRLVRRSSAGCLEVLRFSLLFKHSISSCVNFLALRHSRHQSLGSTQGSGKLYEGKHAPQSSHSQKLAIGPYGACSLLVLT